MRRGCYLWIVNRTPNILQLASQHSYTCQVKSWYFKSVGADSQQCFYIEYDSSIFHTPTEGIIATADFELEGACQHFQLQAVWTKTGKNSGCSLQVDWRETDASRFTVFPPPPRDSSVGRLGWSWGDAGSSLPFRSKAGTLSVLIQEKRRAVPLPTDCTPVVNGEPQQDVTLPTSTITASPSISRDTMDAPTDVPQSSIPEVTAELDMQSDILPSTDTVAVPSSRMNQWMECYSDVLKELTLTEMTLPGTHNSGTCRPVAVYPANEIIRTQSMSLRNQLNLGIRVLDLRIGQNSPGNYIISHDKYRTRYSLSDALQEIVGFINDTRKEIVILDFHRFNNLGQGDFDFDQLKAEVNNSFDGYRLLPNSQGRTLGEIWQTCGRQRIVVAWNHDQSYDPTYMWPGVKQSWYRYAYTVDQLYSAIEDDMRNPPDNGMWSAGVFLAPSFHTRWQPINNAKLLNPIIDNWFYGCATWTIKANIITTNFFEGFNHTVQACICASILKTGCKA